MKQSVAAAVLTLSLFLGASRAADAACFPVYGNWCGSGYPKDGDNPPVWDAFDLACKRHDRCYDRLGAGEKSCDAHLVTELRALYRQYGYLPRALQWAERYFTVQGINGESVSDPGFDVDDLYSLFGSLVWDCSSED